MTDKRKGWIGVDLDGTLAYQLTPTQPGVIGDPVPAMLDRVKRWLADREDVRIFTARVSVCRCDSNAEYETRMREVIDNEHAIRAWCQRHLGTLLPITCVKDYEMKALYDDRAVQVGHNTGVTIEGVADYQSLIREFTERNYKLAVANRQLAEQVEEADAKLREVGAPDQQITKTERPARTTEPFLKSVTIDDAVYHVPAAVADAFNAMKHRLADLDK